jgi:hypothetical protein
MEPKLYFENRQIFIELLRITSNKMNNFGKVRVSRLKFKHAHTKNLTIDEPTEQYSPPIHTYKYTECPTTYQTWQFFNNSNTNDDIAKRFEQEYVRCVRNEEECVCSAPNCWDTEQRSAS